MKINVLASGSDGNCFFICNNNTRLLVDCGISNTEILQRLKNIGEHPNNIHAVLVTHEHNDHTYGLRGFVKGYRPAICAAADTPLRSLHGVFHSRIPLVKAQWLTIGDFDIMAVGVQHDAADPVSFLIREHGGGRVAILTDLGFVNPYTADWCSGADWLFVEANHDKDVLSACAYEPALKKRVANNHLSNDQAFWLVEASEARRTVLGHISTASNDLRLLRALSAKHGNRVSLAEPGQQTEVFHVN